MNVLVGRVALCGVIASLSCLELSATDLQPTFLSRPSTLDARPEQPAARQAKPLSRWEQTARELLRELIEINTTESSGSTARAAHAMAARVRAAGFPESDVAVVEHAPRKGNLIVRLRGRSSAKKPILLLSHLDVVEAKAEDWTLAPFSFIEKEGTFYGRGVADDKDEGAIHLALVMRLRAEGFVPDRDIIVALTADEEGGPANGVAWLLENRRNLIDAEFAFNEGGGGRSLEGVKVSNDVQASEKKFQNFSLEATNPGGHSSVPVKDNAITHLSQSLVRIGAFDFPVRLNEITRAYFSRSSAHAGGTVGPAMAAIVANPSDSAALRVLAADPRFNSQLRTTCVATMVEGGHARNALPQRARANVNCRILPDESTESVQKTLEQVIGNPKVTITPSGEAQHSPASPLSVELMGQIERISNELWPGLPIIPTMSTGATDGLYLRNAGIPTYGVSGLFYGDTGAHGMNERIPAEGFYQGLEFMYRLVKSLTRGGVI
jgi:acetylornithine deacetylase/succinyl-diaminopimelate desuccinylase-like protein